MKLSKLLFISVINIFTLQSISAQTCSNLIVKNAPDIRYKIVEGSDGAEVKDIKTGLIWQRCSMGQIWGADKCIGDPKAYTWSEALQRSHALGNGYRLPNIKELETLVEEGCSSPAINTQIFPTTSTNHYWSSSPKTSDNRYAWSINFDEGNINSDSIYYKNAKKFNVRAVRNANP